MFEWWSLKAHDISQSIIGCMPFDLADLQSVKYVKDQALMVNVLWEVAYRVCHEVLHLDLLEDFSATEVDLMDLKNDILAMWESRDRCRTSSLGPMFTPSSTSASQKGSTFGKTFTPSKASVSAGILHGYWLWPGRNIIAPLETLSPTSWDPTTLGALILHAGNLADIKLLCNGVTHEVTILIP